MALSQSAKDSMFVGLCLAAVAAGGSGLIGWGALTVRAENQEAAITELSKTTADHAREIATLKAQMAQAVSASKDAAVKADDAKEEAQKANVKLDVIHNLVERLVEGSGG